MKRRDCLASFAAPCFLVLSTLNLSGQSLQEALAKSMGSSVGTNQSSSNATNTIGKPVTIKYSIKVAPKGGFVFPSTHQSMAAPAQAPITSSTQEPQPTSSFQFPSTPQEQIKPQTNPQARDNPFGHAPQAGVSKTGHGNDKFFDHHAGSTYKRSFLNPVIIGSWSGSGNVSGNLQGVFSLSISFDNYGFFDASSSMMSSLSAGPFDRWSGCLFFGGNWSSTGSVIDITFASRVDVNGVLVQSSDSSSNAVPATWRFKLNELGRLIFLSGPNIIEADGGYFVKIPYGTILNKVANGSPSPLPASASQEPIDLHTCYRNAAFFSNKAYEEADGSTIRIPVGLSGVCKPDFYPTGNFGATIHLGNDGRYYLAFKGTATKDDWWADAVQATGFQQTQYQQAIQLASFYQEALDPNREGKLIITGHSLGGGMALAAVLKTYGYAITFNQASVNTLYSVGTRPKCVINYRMDGDPVIKTAELFSGNFLQKFYNLLVGDSKLSSYGENITLKPIFSLFNFIQINKHSISQFLQQPCNPDGSVQQCRIIKTSR